MDGADDDDGAMDKLLLVNVAAEAATDDGVVVAEDEASPVAADCVMVVEVTLLTGAFTAENWRSTCVNDVLAV